MEKKHLEFNDSLLKNIINLNTVNMVREAANDKQIGSDIFIQLTILTSYIHTLQQFTNLNITASKLTSNFEAIYELSDNMEDIDFKYYDDTFDEYYEKLNLFSEENNQEESMTINNDELINLSAQQLETFKSYWYQISGLDK